jgi:predicted transcriptional regulator of viral defense system
LKFLDFKTHFEPFKVFSTHDVLKWDADFDTRRLVEWQDKNYLLKIINRWYIFSDVALDQKFLYLVANRIYAPSYVSFESALSFYNLIPEGVYTITSATTLKTKSFSTSAGKFVFRHIRPELMFGYKLMEVQGQHYKLAEPEKVILDYLYLNTDLINVHDFESVRLNRAECTRQIQVNKLMNYLSLYKSKALEKRVAGFLNRVQYA